jgi:hypothetical protein
MQKLQDLSGERFGLLLVKRRVPAPDAVRGQVFWECECECGKLTVVRAANLRGKTRSCGCLKRQMVTETNTRHGHAKKGQNSPEYKAWIGMKDRCGRKTSSSYQDYGERGIAVCGKWLGDFEAFLADMGPKPGPEYSLERTDVNIGYQPDNCVWATEEEQLNNKRTSRRLTFNGVTQTAAQWSRDLNLPISTIANRIAFGMSDELVLQIKHPAVAKVPEEKIRPLNRTQRGESQRFGASRVVDITGQTFGLLTVISRVDAPSHVANKGDAYFEARCTCGNVVVRASKNIRRDMKGTLSCGCVNQIKDVIGQRFGRLTVVAEGQSEYRGKQLYRTLVCVCDCGAEKIVSRQNVLNETTSSCGCLAQEMGVMAYKHGGSKTAEHKIWSGVKARCLAPDSWKYRHYGGRGIGICAEWRDDFSAFLKDMGPRPSTRHSVERREVDGDYCPGNCYWGLPADQARNKRNTVLIECDGQALTAGNWAAKTGIPAYTIRNRIRSGWTIQRALGMTEYQTGTIEDDF